jgi:hypothetical protein
MIKRLSKLISEEMDKTLTKQILEYARTPAEERKREE